MPIKSGSDLGLLKLLGYGVGRNGLNVFERREILKTVYDISIPDIRSMERIQNQPIRNFNEWGAPRSRQRRSKMISTITSFIDKYEDYSSHFEAVRNWKNDRDWINRNSNYFGFNNAECGVRS